MKLGISTASFFNRAPTEMCFELLRRLRVPVTEVFLNTYSEYEREFVDELRQYVGDIEVHSVHCLGTQFEPQLFNMNMRVRLDAESIFRKVCCAAYTLGAKYYTFHGPIRLKRKQYPCDYDKLSVNINRLVDIADGCGIKLSYENVHWTYASDPEFFKQILQRCPRLYTTFDVKQAVQAGQDPYKIIDAMGDRISTVHLCDVCKDDSTALPGQGRINFEKILRQLDKVVPNVRVLIEAYSGDYEEMKELTGSYDYISDIIAKLKK